MTEYNPVGIGIECIENKGVILVETSAYFVVKITSANDGQ